MNNKLPKGKKGASMAKRTIKAKKGLNPHEERFHDADRIVPRAEGGDYTPDNVEVVSPQQTMRRHGTLRIRSSKLEELKTICDDREQLIRLKNKINNQLLAYARQTDNADTETRNFLNEQAALIERKTNDKTDELKKWVKDHKDPKDAFDQLLHAADDVLGIGPVTMAYMAVYVDLGEPGKPSVYPAFIELPDGKKVATPNAGQEKAPHPSSLWAYVGYDVPSHQRYQKGKASGGNKTLRTMLYNTACSCMKQKTGAYRKVYNDVRNRLDNSLQITKSRNTKGQLVDIAWKDTKKGHRHGTGLRIIAKHFLADYWFVGRTILGLPTEQNALYVNERLGHYGALLNPGKRGWIYPGHDPIDPAVFPDPTEEKDFDTEIEEVVQERGKPLTKTEKEIVRKAKEL